MKAFLPVCLVACSSLQPTPLPDASVRVGAQCERVGTELCAKLFACGTPMGYADEASCVAQQNSACEIAKPGFCKGAIETSEAAAGACADSLHAMTCSELAMPTSSGPCKEMLCAP